MPAAVKQPARRSGHRPTTNPDTSPGSSGKTRLRTRRPSGPARLTLRRCRRVPAPAALRATRAPSRRGAIAVPPRDEANQAERGGKPLHRAGFGASGWRPSSDRIGSSAPSSARRAGGGDLVIAPLRPRFSRGDALTLPLRSHVAGLLEPPERRINRARRVAGDVDDLETVTMAARDGLQDESGGERDPHDYVDNVRRMRRQTPPAGS